MCFFAISSFISHAIQCLDYSVAYKIPGNLLWTVSLGSVLRIESYGNILGGAWRAPWHPRDASCDRFLSEHNVCATRAGLLAKTFASKAGLHLVQGILRNFHALRYNRSRLAKWPTE